MAVERVLLLVLLAEGVDELFLVFFVEVVVAGVGGGGVVEGFAEAGGGNGAMLWDHGELVVQRRHLYTILDTAT